MKSYSDNTVERTRSGTRPPSEKELDSFDKVGLFPFMLCSL